ncbi:RNA-binding protein [Candidatus Gracilibacteria bacterium]|jgi:RNA recognition motif-containing protein|nr:RNA-binding protein [Candidatus Gracilibacteria bacterium]
MSQARLFIGNISFRTTEEGLKEAFSKAGTVVSAQIIMDKFTGRSRGFGFVEMSSDQEAQEAIAMFNDKDLDGREIKVNVAREREERPPRREGGFGDRSF